MAHHHQAPLTSYRNNEIYSIFVSMFTAAIFLLFIMWRYYKMKSDLRKALREQLSSVQQQHSSSSSGGGQEQQQAHHQLHHHHHHSGDYTDGATSPQRRPLLLSSSSSSFSNSGSGRRWSHHSSAATSPRDQYPNYAFLKSQTRERLRMCASRIVHLDTA